MALLTPAAMYADDDVSSQLRGTLDD